MSAIFSDDDVGKPVENGDGEAVGIVQHVEGNLAHVRPNPSAVESIKSSLGWDGVVEKTVTLEGASVRERTAEAVRLEGALPTSDRSGDGNPLERDGADRSEAADRGR